MINVVLINGTKSRMQKALIDSGADYTLINASIAEDLGIDLKSCLVDKTLGIENRPIDTYYYDLELAIPNLDQSNLIVKTGFVKSSSVGILLGQRDFFDKFVICFNKKKNYFEIDLSV